MPPPADTPATRGPGGPPDAHGTEPPRQAPRNGAPPRVFWPALIGVVAADVVTKYLAHTRLAPHVPHEVVGDVARITLTYNPGAAFGMSVGAASRWVFLALTAVILVFLGRLYRETPPGAVSRALALGLVCGGAVGNLINRLWSARGVVDFIDVGLGDVRFWTFNVADIGVSVGAVLLVWALWREDAAEARRKAGADHHDVRSAES